MPQLKTYWKQYKAARVRKRSAVPYSPEWYAGRDDMHSIYRECIRVMGCAPTAKRARPKEDVKKKKKAKR